MVPPVEIARLAGRSWICRVLMLALIAALLAGCGSATLRGDQPAAALATITPASSNTPASCPPAVLKVLANVLENVYHEGVASERTGSANYLITTSAALREAVESGDKAAARAAAKALLKTGHVSALRVMRGTQTFISVGGPALTPLRGTLTDATGAPIATYVASVWADNGFLVEAGGITQGLVILSRDGHSVGGSPALSTHGLKAEGVLTYRRIVYRYIALPAEAYPSGAIRIYVLLPLSSTTPLCGPTSRDTTVNTLMRVADLIYEGESGEAAKKQVRRVQSNKPLLEAVEQRNPQAAKLAIDTLLHEHVVRLRVSAGGRLLSDVGGPYVLAPVSAPLMQDGHEIGSLELSVQDDEGYLRLTRRLAGLDVLMYMHPNTTAQLVKDSLGHAPGPALATVPASGSYKYDGRSFRVFTVHAEAFPSGPLTIRVLVPFPYP
jgi:hypothetical protein